MNERFEFHILQSFAPSNLNRDDTGAPKDAIFGGVRRGRISSQALKRAARMYMQDAGLVPEHARSYRTKRITNLLAGALTTRGAEASAAQAAAAAVIQAIGGTKKMKLKDGKTEYLLFIGHNELERLADAIWRKLQTSGTGKFTVDKGLSGEVESILADGGKGAIDVALFGRMLANLPEANADASCQVAHAISTHRVDRDFDYYTAVDDLKPDDTAGADMIGTVEFNSACYYRFSVIDLQQLAENLGESGLARGALTGYTKAVVEAIPTGKQNSFAAHNAPSMVLALKRLGQAPRNLANAFEAPVTGRGQGLIADSVRRVADYWQVIDEAYGSASAAILLDLTGTFPDRSSVRRVRSLEELCEAVVAASSLA